MKTLIVLTLLLIPFATLQAQQNFDEVQIEPVKLNDHIYMLKGAGGNIGVLTGVDGVVMIDDQFAPLSERIKSAIKKLDPGEINFIINTHIHGDHTGGNENFKQDGVTIVAHDNVRERMMSLKLNEKTQQKEPARNALAWPVITFSSGVNFHLDGEDVEVTHFARGHTDGDVIIHFVQSDIFHTGDSFISSGYPFIDLSSGGSIDGFITNLEKILEMADDQSRIIPGHGEISTKTDVQKFRDRLKEIRDQVVAALNNGTKKEDLGGLPVASKYDGEWGNGFVKGKDFVLTVAESYLQENPK
jgi:cyclase